MSIPQKLYATVYLLVIVWIVSLIVGSLFSIGLAAPWGFQNKTCFLLIPCDPNYAAVLPGETLYFLPGTYDGVTLRMYGEEDRPARAKSLFEHKAVMRYMTIDGGKHWIVENFFMSGPPPSPQDIDWDEPTSGHMTIVQESSQ